jgi:hypothetical protein
VTFYQSRERQEGSSKGRKEEEEEGRKEVRKRKV